MPITKLEMGLLMAVVTVGFSLLYSIYQPRREA
jgi:hypothetical protein